MTGYLVMEGVQRKQMPPGKNARPDTLELLIRKQQVVEKKKTPSPHRPSHSPHFLLSVCGFGHLKFLLRCSYFLSFSSSFNPEAPYYRSVPGMLHLLPHIFQHFFVSTLL